MKKRITIALSVLFLSASLFATERDGDQGLGVMIGKPTGLSYKMWLQNNYAFDAAVGIDEGEFDVHATLLWHNFNWLKNIDEKAFKNINENGDLPFYVGIGPRALFRDETEIGIRVPVGLSYLPHESLWEFFGEVAPVLRLTPHAGIDADFAVGARFYFPAIRSRSKTNVD